MIDKSKWKYVHVEDCQPNATKKGLRVKVREMAFDENDVLREIFFDYSLYRCRGSARVEVAERNPVEIMEVQNG